jgi:four helix bundle protein
MKKSFRDLKAWQRGIDLAVEVYQVTEQFPIRERFGLTQQMRKAGVSVPSNVAEGQGRLTERDWRHFVGTSRGSLNELETQAEIARRLGFLDIKTFTQLRNLLDEVGRLLNGLLKYLDKRC